MGGILAVLCGRLTTDARNSRALQSLFGGAMLAGFVVVLGLSCSVGLNLPSNPPPWPALTLFAINGFWFGLIGLIVLHAGSPLLRVLVSRPLVYLGRISYGIYLYHFVILMATAELAHALGYRHSLLSKAAAIAFSFRLAALSWKFIERPILKWKERYDYGSAGVRPETNSTPTAEHVRTSLASPKPIASSH
ncbi:MAG: acyltransferase [Isosphaeraceae bacterium]|nr:acyltransferase [Isosphaeraceae bacterium]